MKNTISWSVTPCSVVDIDSSVPEMEVLVSSENLVNIYQTAGLHAPEVKGKAIPVTGHGGP
jgi:hypothetical protein